jgi:hypothetical protein
VRAAGCCGRPAVAVTSSSRPSGVWSRRTFWPPTLPVQPTHSPSLARNTSARPSAGSEKLAFASCEPMFPRALRTNIALLNKFLIRSAGSTTGRSAFLQRFGHGATSYNSCRNRNARCLNRPRIFLAVSPHMRWSSVTTKVGQCARHHAVHFQKWTFSKCCPTPRRTRARRGNDPRIGTHRSRPWQASWSATEVDDRDEAEGPTTRRQE